MAARRVTLTAAWKKLLFLLFALTSLLSAAERPQIVVLLVDAMGFADPGCHGSQIPPPNLHALVKTGLRFTLAQTADRWRNEKRRPDRESHRTVGTTDVGRKRGRYTSLHQVS